MMKVPCWVRLCIYIIIAILPTWIDFFTKSTDYSFRGLMMPILASFLTGCTVFLARTVSDHPEPPAS